MKLKWGISVVAVGVLVLTVGCRRIDEGKVYHIAQEHVERVMGTGVDISPRDEARFAVGKNAARVDLDYRRGGSDPAEGYMTVWCKRVRMRWELDRATDYRNAMPSTP